jgi:hypothetical protein
VRIRPCSPQRSCPFTRIAGYWRSECQAADPSILSTRNYARAPLIFHYQLERGPLLRVQGRYPGPNTKLGISVVAVWHITDHYGQIVEYPRMNGIAPPSSQKYGLKVR